MVVDLLRVSRLRLPELNPFFLANRVSGALQPANRRFEAIRANRSNVMKIVLLANRFPQIDSRELPRFALRIAGPSIRDGETTIKTIRKGKLSRNAVFLGNAMTQRRTKGGGKLRGGENIP